MKHIKLFEDHSDKDSYTLITFNWNSYLIKTDDLKDRPDVNDKKYQGNGSADERYGKWGKDEDQWGKRKELIYVTPELKKLWGHREGYGFSNKDVRKPLFKGIDFDVEKRDTIEHSKIARGEETKTLKNFPCAIPQIKV